MKRLIYTAMLLSTAAFVNAQILVDDFNYGTGGDTLTSHGWTVTAASVVNIVKTVSPGLTYPGYLGSGIGNAAAVANNGQDIYSEGTPFISSGTAYASFMAKVSAAQATGDYFFALLPSNSASNFTARVYAKAYNASYFQIGIAKTNEPVSYSPDSFLYNSTLLFVASYQFNTGSVTNDSIRLYVFKSGVPSSEPLVPTATIVNPSSSDQPNIARVVIRQGSASQAPTLVIDGIRLADSWSNAPLPVKLSSFNGVKEKTGALLTWATASEVNNNHFDVERSIDGENFITIGQVKGNGNTTILSNYQFTDEAPAPGINYYRLKQVDADGLSEYSLTIKVSGNVLPQQITTNPNPFGDQLAVNVYAEAEASVQVAICDVVGKQHYNEPQNLAKGSNTISINTAGLPAGIYFVKLTGNGAALTKKIIKN